MDVVHDQLQWALGRLAILQGSHLDANRLRLLLTSLKGRGRGLSILHTLCIELKLRSPKFLTLPDIDRLPLIIYDEKSGWGVIVSRERLGDWIVEFSSCVLRMKDDQVLEKSAQIGLLQRRGAVSSRFQSHLHSAFLATLASQTNLILAAFGIAGLMLILMWYSAGVIEHIILDPTAYHVLAYALLWVFAVGVVRAGYQTLIYQIHHRVEKGLNASLGDTLLDQLLFHGKKIRSSDMPMASHFLANGWPKIRSFYADGTQTLLESLPVLCLFSVLIWNYGLPSMTVIIALGGILVLLLEWVAHEHCWPSIADQRSVQEQIKQLAFDLVYGTSTIQLLGARKEVSRRWRSIQGIRTESSRTHQPCKLVVVIVRAQILLACGAAGLIIGIESLQRHEISSGVFVVQLINVVEVGWFFNQIRLRLSKLREVQDLVQKIADYYPRPMSSESHDAGESNCPIQGDFHFVAVQFSYDQRRTAIQVNRLSIRRGERIGIIGPTGAGKSSLLSLFSGRQTPQQGVIYLDDLDIDTYSPYQLNSQIALMPEKPYIFNGTLRENMVLGVGDPSDSTLQIAIEKTGLARLVDALPMGLNQEITEYEPMLSSGLRHLIGLCRVMLRTRSVYLLDEPTRSLDDALKAECMTNLCKELHGEGKTLVIATTDFKLLEWVDRVLVVVANHVVMDGARDEILKRVNRLGIDHTAQHVVQNV